MFTKRATNVETQEMCTLPIVFWWKFETFLSAKPEVELIVTVALISLMPDISKIVRHDV